MRNCRFIIGKKTLYKVDGDLDGERKRETTSLANATNEFAKTCLGVFSRDHCYAPFRWTGSVVSWVFFHEWVLLEGPEEKTKERMNGRQKRRAKFQDTELYARGVHTASSNCGLPI